MSDIGPIMIAGDHTVPAGTHIDRDLLVTGLLQLGDDVVCDGDVLGARGVITGMNVRIAGDIYSRGPVSLGPGTLLVGSINPKQPDARPDAAVVHVDGPDTSELEVLRSVGIPQTFAILHELGWDAHREGAPGYPNSWWGLGWDGAAAVLDRLIEMLDQAYRPGREGTEWDQEDIYDLLFSRVASSIIPMHVRRTHEHEVEITIARPERTMAPGGETAGWPWPTICLLTVLGYGCNPGFSMDLIGDESLIAPDADPKRIEVVARIDERPDDAYGSGDGLASA